MQAGATYADAAESVGIPDSTTASFPSQGTASYRALLKIYVDEAASGVLSVLLDLVKLILNARCHHGLIIIQLS